MKNLDIDLVDHREASVESSGDGYVYVTVDAEFGLIPDSPIYLEYQLLCLKDDVVVSSSDPSSAELTFENPRVYITDSFHAGEDQIPDSYKINFRVFVPDEPVVIDTPIPPEIARQSGAFLIHSPKKGLLAREKWASGGVTAESVVVKNVAGEDDELFVNLAAKNHTQSGFVLTCESAENSDNTIFKIIDKPQLTSDHLRLHLRKDLKVTLVGYEAGAWKTTEKTAITSFTRAEEYPEEESRGDFSFEEPLLSDYEAVTERAFNWYVNMIKKFDDYDLALEKVTEELDGAVASAGIDSDCGWYSEIPERDFQGLIKGLLGHYRRHYEEDNEREHYLGPLHTWIVGVLYDRNSEIAEDQPEFLDYVTNGFLSDTQGIDETNIALLYIRGGGFEVEGVKLDKGDADALQLAHQELGDGLFLGGRITENASVGQPLFETCYGPNPFDSTFTWEDSSDDPGIDESNFKEVREFVDFQSYQPNQLEFFCVAYGKVFGFAKIPIGDPADFEPEKFVVEYFRFVLDGWPELSGSVITRITYDGEEVEFEPEDNGLDVDTFLLGREYEDGEVVDDVVLHESRAGENQSVDWSRMSKAFS